MLRVFGAVLTVLVLVGCVSGRLPPREALAEALAFETVSLVEVEEAGSAHTFCSGSWVSSSEILTAAHCTEDAEIGTSIAYVAQDDVSVVNGKPFFDSHRAKLAFRDVEHDLALLDAGTLTPLHGVTTLSHEVLRPGQRVFAMGAPLGLGWSFSSGDIAQVRYEDAIGAAIWYVQATAPISPGSSGCGLYDEQGRLVGVARGVYPRGENLNLFVHRDHVEAFMMHAHAGHR